MSNTDPSRAILPIPDAHQPYPGLVAYDAKDPASSFPPIRQRRPPAGAPNVLIVLIDDAGFAASSVFGGVIDTPTAQRLADGGLRYNRFHTTALCSPTRQALLTGRNHHSVGMGGITEIATSAPGYTGVRPNTAAPLAETLKLNGYSTAQFGKCHEVPVYETSPVGPFDAWPTGGGGFEHFYGFIGGETNQWYPAIYDGTTPVEPWGAPEDGYHFTEDMTDHAMAWVRQQKALLPDKPFFMYFAPGATHAPHQPPANWIEPYRGRFDGGWDALRVEILEQQQALGVIPADAELTARPAEIPAWDDMPDDLKPVLARQMEVYAGFMAHTDHNVGRLIDAIDELGVLDDTLVFYIVGDNGASAEGTVNGTFNELLMLNGVTGIETVEFMKSKVDLFGGPEAYNHYSVGWAHAMDTPYQWTKQVASHWGGTRNGTIVHWPNGFTARGEIRSQFCHVIDVAPTVLEAAGLPAPTFVHGVQQMPMQGTSMVYSFDDATVAERHELQYFEMFVNRGIYHQGWTACTRHTLPWVMGPTPALDDDVWELYGPDDWTQAHDIAAEHPAKLAELQRLFLIEATKYNVLPLDDRRVERFNADIAGRPQLIHGNTQLVFGGMGRLSENSVIVIKNKSHAVTANVTVPEQGADGVIIAQGGAFGGWSLYAKDGKPKYCYNTFGVFSSTVEGGDALTPGDHQIRMEFAYDGGGLGKGGDVKLYVDGAEVGTGRVDATVPMVFSADETTDIGRDTGTGVSPDYPTTDNAFTGRVHWVQIDIDDSAEDLDHLITAEERFRIAMARQQLVAMNDGGPLDDSNSLSAEAAAIGVPDRIETPLGAFDMVDGVPTAESVERLYSSLDFVRGVDVFLNAVPGASLVAMRNGFRSVGLTASNQVGYTEPRANSGSFFLTPNTETTYGSMFFDLRETGPFVIEPPVQSLCVVDDFWFRYVADMGIAGPDRGEGGKYLFLPPGFDGDVPDGYFVYRPATYTNWVVLRALGGVPAMKQTRVYALADAHDPPATEFVNIAGFQFNTVHANDFSFFDEVNTLVQEEPTTALDPERAGQLAGIGIVHGRPFAPDAGRRATLEQAALAGAAISRALVYSPRDEEAPIADGSSWLRAFIGGSYEFLQDDRRLLDARTAFHYFATVITPAMAHAQVGAGSAYAYTAHDNDGEILDGAKTYYVTLPPDPPAKNFWSIDVYDTQTRSLLQTDDPYPSVMSTTGTVASNEDGSITIWFGPSAPEGRESNWIQTVHGKSWFPMLRLYGPLQAWFDKTWLPGDVTIA